MSPFLGNWECIARLDRKKNSGKWSNRRESNSYVGWFLSVTGPIYRLVDRASNSELQGKGDLIAGGKIMRLWDIPGGYIITCVIMNNTTIEFEDGSSKALGEHMFCEMLSTQANSDGINESIAAYMFVRK